MKKKICMILIAVFVAVLGASTYFIIDHYKESNKQAELYSELADLVNAAAQTDAATEPAEQIPYSEEKMLLPELAELYQQNGDLVGWISIADTNINYPVMQSVNEPNFYLKHGFDKDYSDYGCPYVQEDCDVQEPSDNLVIYGHHMSNGSMFAHLEKFKNKDFWSEHRIITFNTLTDKQEYEIVAVFRTVVYTDSPEAFKFYRFIDAESANEFDDFIAKCKELSFYDTGVTAEYGDKLITLSTCEYSRNNSRLVVVAKHITEDGGADGGVAPGDEQIDGAVVVLPKGDPLGHRGVDAVVQGAGGVQTDHGQAVDQKDHGVGPVPLPQGASHQQQGADHRQPRADAVGDGRPGAQPVIGVPHLFPAPGLCAGDRGMKRNSRFTHV